MTPNEDRAAKATKVLKLYGGFTPANKYTALVDALADLLHLMGPNAIDEALKTASMHYEHETRKGGSL